MQFAILLPKQGSDKATEPVTKCSSLIKTEDHLKALPRQKEKAGMTKIGCAEKSRSVLSRCHDPPMADKLVHHENQNMSSQALVSSYAEDNVDNLMHSEEYSESSCSYTSEDEETSNVTGLDSPGTKVWDGKSNRNLTLSHIHHPLENSDGRKTRRMGKGHVHHVLHRTQTRRKRSRSSSQKVPVWQEIERTSFLSGDGQDILNSFKGHVKSEDSNDDSDAETLGRIHSGETASSSAPLTSLPPMNAQKNLLLADSFLKLRCEVLGANIVKSGSKTFAVYSISVTDINNNSWSIKRRFRHFEELHRRLKEFPEYNLHLPPKHFLSTGLDVPVIQERCKLLDQYLKKLLHLPTISGSIEVWDFLSVDSQTYMFSNSISIIETLSVDLDYTLHERRKKIQTAPSAAVDPLPSWREQNNAESKIAALPIKHSLVANESKLNKGAVHYSQEKPEKEHRKPFEDSGSDSDNVENRNMSLAEKSIKGNEHNDLQASARTLTDATTDPALPTEWVPPSLSVPILDLVDVVFQLQDGGWIRRKAFWVAKQVLQLGMGDAFDDWLIEKIQLLRRGTVVASGIRRIEQILWPDGIFITKHPRRQRPTASGNTPVRSTDGQPPISVSSPKKIEDVHQWEEQQQKEAEGRAKFVYELMIDNAPAAIVSLFGRKEYEQCAKDLYYFIQSAVCVKQLAFDLLELLLLSAFPEMDYVFMQLHEEREKFGEVGSN